jgi:hypothetical protein
MSLITHFLGVGYGTILLCIEPQKIYSPGGCHKIVFLSTFLHNGPQPISECFVLKFDLYQVVVQRLTVRINGHFVRVFMFTGFF